jgi:hypothetical protein
MSETQFHETRMGRTYYESTLPSLVRELQRLNTALELLAERAATLPPKPTPPPSADPTNPT